MPRSEVEEVEKLRDNWQEVIDLAEQCRVKLLKERRGAFEQELDKQVKVRGENHMVRIAQVVFSVMWSGRDKSTLVSSSGVSDQQSVGLSPGHLCSLARHFTLMLRPLHGT